MEDKNIILLEIQRKKQYLNTVIENYRFTKKAFDEIEAFVLQIESKKITPEKMAERVLYDCKINKVDPHQLMIALQNLMDLS